MNGEIDYSMSIKNFKTMTDTNDDELAIKYLSKYDWDETKAAHDYLENPPRNSNLDKRSSPPINQNQSRGFFANLLDGFNNILNIPNILGSHFQNTDIYEPRAKKIPIPHEQIRNINNEGENINISNELLNDLPFKTKDLNEFFNSIYTKVGILFIYETNNVKNILEIFYSQIYSDPEIISIIDHQFVTYCLEAKSKEAVPFMKKKMSLPFCIFLYNPFSLERDDPQLTLDSLQGLTNLNKFKDYIYKTLSLKENLHINSVEKNDQEDSHASIIRNQKEELRKLEQEEALKHINIKLEENKLVSKKIEIKEPVIKKIILPDEPNINCTDASLILFRFPDGHGRIERRFFKTNKISDLYSFVESLENQSFNKEGQFELVQTFPYKVFNKIDSSLEEEKLFPNAVIQIKELD